MILQKIKPHRALIAETILAITSLSEALNTAYIISQSGYPFWIAMIAFVAILATTFFIGIFFLDQLLQAVEASMNFKKVTRKTIIKEWVEAIFSTGIALATPWLILEVQLAATETKKAFIEAGVNAWNAIFHLTDIPVNVYIPILIFVMHNVLLIAIAIFMIPSEEVKENEDKKKKKKKPFTQDTSDLVDGIISKISGSLMDTNQYKGAYSDKGELKKALVSAFKDHGSDAMVERFQTYVDDNNRRNLKSITAALLKKADNKFEGVQTGSKRAITIGKKELEEVGN